MFFFLIHVHELFEIHNRSISLWSTQKKKPIFTYPLAHGLHQVQSSTEGLLKTPRWITALAALAYSDLFISGASTNNHYSLFRYFTYLCFLLFSASFSKVHGMVKSDYGNSIRNLNHSLF